MAQDVQLPRGGATTAINGTFIHTGGVCTVGRNLRIGWLAGGVYEIGGDAQLTAANLQLGGKGTGVCQPGCDAVCILFGTGTFVQDGQAVVTVTNLLSVGVEHTGVCGPNPNCVSGEYELHGGTLHAPETRVADGKNGRFLQTGGAHAVDTLLYLGFGSDTVGRYDLDGGELSARILYVGWNGAGEMVQTGGRVTCDQVFLGRNTVAGDPAQKYTLSGTGELSVRNLSVARAGLGALIVEGGRLVAGTVDVGRLSLGQGSVEIADPGSEILVATSLILGRGGLLDAVPGSRIVMTHDASGSDSADFENLSFDAFQLPGLNNLELSFEGAPAVPSNVEVAGRDIGTTGDGFIGNFALGTLRVGPAAQVLLQDAHDNGNRGASGEPEALYVDALVLEAGSIFDLNGLNVYYRTSVIEGLQLF